MNAILSPDGLYRYFLRRDLGGDEDKHVLFVMLNPSRADAVEDDPTIRRCIGFARREGAAALGVVNLYAYRSPTPTVLRSVADPVGPENEEHLIAALRTHDVVICAWGADEGPIRGRSRGVARLALREQKLLWCLGTTRHGHPRHPLYLAGDTPLAPWSPR